MKLFVGYKNDIWEVLAFRGKRFLCNRSTRLWLCKCFCGKEVVRKSQEIMSGRAKSCGCYKQDRPGNKYKHDYHTTHGFSKGKKHPLYINWLGMKQRCFNDKHASYKNYGGKGVTICKEWLDPSVFIKWALDNKWKLGMSVDRTDNSGNYEPSNCTIMTKSENSRKVAIENPGLHVGSNHRYSKINESIVGKIKILLSDGKMGTEIAKEFNISKAIVYGIKWKMTWKHVI